MAESIIAVAASTWVLVMALAPLLQAGRLIRTGSSRDVSVGYYSVLIPGFVLWVAYGAINRDWFIVVPNAVATATGAALVVLILALRQRGRG